MPSVESYTLFHLELTARKGSPIVVPGGNVVRNTRVGAHEVAHVLRKDRLAAHRGKIFREIRSGVSGRPGS